MDDLRETIIRTALEHDGQYLLRRRFGRRRFGRRRAYDPPSDLDKEYEVCEALVNEGRARWLDRSGPGISLRPGAATPEDPT